MILRTFDKVLATDHIYTQYVLAVIIAIIIVVVDVGFIKISKMDNFRKRLC